MAVKQAGLPNITGTFNIRGNVGFGNAGVTGCVTKVANIDSTTMYTAYIDYDYTGTPLKIDAALSNTIYGKSTTVQPPTLSLVPQIKY